MNWLYSVPEKSNMRFSNKKIPNDGIFSLFNQMAKIWKLCFILVIQPTNENVGFYSYFYSYSVFRPVFLMLKSTSVALLWMVVRIFAFVSSLEI